MEIELKITDEEDSNNNRRGSAFDGHVRMEDINKVKNNIKKNINIKNNIICLDRKIEIILINFLLNV